MVLVLKVLALFLFCQVLSPLLRQYCRVGFGHWSLGKETGGGSLSLFLEKRKNGFQFVDLLTCRGEVFMWRRAAHFNHLIQRYQ